eukprot:6214412-Pleurochrysis_carterae.AAC.2
MTALNGKVELKRIKMQGFASECGTVAILATRHLDLEPVGMTHMRLAVTDRHTLTAKSFAKRGQALACRSCRVSSVRDGGPQRIAACQRRQPPRDAHGARRERHGIVAKRGRSFTAARAHSHVSSADF